MKIDFTRNIGFLLLAIYCLYCICPPSEECRTQITDIRQFRQDYREGLLVSALTSGHFSGLMYASPGSLSTSPLTAPIAGHFHQHGTRLSTIMMDHALILRK